MRTAFQGAVAQMLPVYDLILLLKVARDGAFFILSDSNSDLVKNHQRLPIHLLAVL